MSETTAEKAGETAGTTGETPDLLSMIAGEAAVEVAKVTGETPRRARRARRAREGTPAGETPAGGNTPAGETPAGGNTSTVATLPAGASREKVAPTVKVYPIGVAMTLCGNVYRVRILSRNTSDDSVRVAVGTGDDCTIPVNPTAERIPSRDVIPGEKVTVAEGLASFTADHNAVCDSLTSHPFINPGATSWEGVMVGAAVTGERDDVFPMGAGETAFGTFTRTPDGWTFTREGDTTPMVIPGGTNKGQVWTFPVDIATWEASAVVFRSLPPATLPRARAMFRETFSAFSGMVGVVARMGGADAVRECLSHVVGTLRAYPPVAGK